MIKELTKEQEATLSTYRQEAIKVGLATGDGTMDESLVRELTDEHRVSRGLSKATHFIVESSPLAVLSNPEYTNMGFTTGNALYGQHDVNWLYYHKFFREQCGLVKETDAIKFLLELTNHVNWMWMTEDTTVVTHRPIHCHLLAMKVGVSRLHNPNGLALEYKDGRGVYALRGIRCSKKLAWFFTPDKKSIDPAKILDVENTEIRGEMIKAMGPDFFESLISKTTLDKDNTPTGGDYELYSVDINGDIRKYLTGVCPSQGTRWHEKVPPTCNTVKEANSWRYTGAIKNELVEPRLRT